MEKKEIIYLSIILGIFYALFLVLPVNAVVQVQSPVNSSNVSGSVTFNATWNVAGTIDIVNVRNVTFFANGTSIGVISNTTDNPSSISGSLSTTGVTDGIYFINATVRNITDTVFATIVTNLVTIDNTDPICTLTRLTSPNINTFEINELNIVFDPSGSSDARSGINTCNISIVSQSGSTTYASKQQSGSCSNTQTFRTSDGSLAKINPETEVRVVLNVTDYLSRSCTIGRDGTRNIKLTGDIVITGEEEEEKQFIRIKEGTITIGKSKQIPLWMIGMIFVFVLIVVIGGLNLRKK